MSNKMGRPIELDGVDGPWNALAYAVGGVDELAKLLHVSRRTVYRFSTKDQSRIPFAFKQLVNDIAAAANCKLLYPEVGRRKAI